MPEFELDLRNVESEVVDGVMVIKAAEVTAVSLVGLDLTDAVAGMVEAVTASAVSVVGLSAEEATANMHANAAAFARATGEAAVADLDIAAFLRARLDEREAVALAATPGPWESEGDDPTDDEVYTVHDGEHGDLIGNVVAFARGGDRQQPNTVHIADNDPEFVLADVAAKRQIIAMHERAVSEYDTNHGLGGTVRVRFVFCGGCQCEDGVITGEWPCDHLRLLAVPYAGHPDYDESWKL